MILLFLSGCTKSWTEPQLPDKSAELPGTSQLFSCPDPCLYSLSIPNNVTPDALGFFNTNTWSNIAFTQVSFTGQIIHHPLTAATLMWDMAFLTWLLMQHLFNCTGASDLCHVWIKVLITLDAKDIFARKMLCSVWSTKVICLVSLWILWITAGKQQLTRLFLCPYYMLIIIVY